MARPDENAPLWPVAWERKGSKGDLWGTLTSGIDRFKREVERAKESNVTLYLGIECSMTDIYKGYEHSEVLGSQIIRTLFAFKVKHGVEPVFCGGRNELKYHIVECFDALDRHYFANKNSEQVSSLGVNQAIPVTEPLGSFGSDIMPEGDA